MIAVQDNIPEVQAALAEYIRGTGVEEGKAVRTASQGATRTVLLFTPPFQSLSTKESFAVQRKVGRFAVKRDIGRAFKAIEDLRVVKTPKNQLVFKKVVAALEKQNPTTIALLLQKLRYPNIAPSNSVERPTDVLHNQLRVRGRIPKGTRPFFVFGSGEVTAFLDEKLELLGQAKSGWAPAGLALGVAIPEWITRHASVGSVVDSTGSFLDPSFRALNNVAYLYNFASETRFVELALEREAGSLRRQVEAHRQGLWNKRGLTS